MQTVREKANKLKELGLIVVLDYLNVGERDKYVFTIYNNKKYNSKIKFHFNDNESRELYIKRHFKKAKVLTVKEFDTLKGEL